jgi:hypothetical protein
MASSQTSPVVDRAAVDSVAFPRRGYLLPAVVAFLLRVSWMAMAGTYVLYHGDPSDAWFYGFEMGSVARSLAHGLGFSSPFDIFVGRTGPTAWVGPLYPLMFAGVIKVFGDFSVIGTFLMMSLNCLFSALTCIPIYLAAKKTMGSRVAWLAAWTWALVPYFNLWHTWLWDVDLSALLLMTIFYLTLRVGEERDWRNELALGGVVGLGALSNPAVLALTPASFAWIAWQRRSERQWVRPMLIVCATAALMLAPWVVRNRIAFGQTVVLRSNFGAEFYLRNQHGMTLDQWLRGHPAINWYEGADYRKLGELAYNRDRMAKGIHYVRQYPAEFARVCLARVLAFWSGSWQTGYGEDPFWHHLYLPLSMLGLVGMLMAIVKRMNGRWLYLGALALFPLVYYITQPLTRYEHSIEPVLLILACFAICEVVSSISKRVGATINLESRAFGLVGWTAVVLLVIGCGATGIARAAARNSEAFAPQATLSPERFMQTCGHPDEISTDGDVVELDYQKAKVRVRIVDNTYGWVFDRKTGNLVTSAQSLGCWSHPAAK